MSRASGLGIDSSKVLCDRTLGGEIGGIGNTADAVYTSCYGIVIASYVPHGYQRAPIPKSLNFVSLLCVYARYTFAAFQGFQLIGGLLGAIAGT